MVTPPTLSRPRAFPLSVWVARIAYTTTLVALIFAALGVMGVAAYNFNYEGRFYSGVRVWGVDVSGMKPEEAGLALSIAFNYPQSFAFIFRDDDKAWTATPAQLGVTFDLPVTLLAAYRVGRSGQITADLNAQWEAWYFGTQISPIVTYDKSRTQAYLDSLAGELFLPTLEALLQANGAEVTTTPGQIGRQLDVAAMAEAVRPHLYSLTGAEIPLIFIETPPLVLDASAQAAAAKAIVSQPLTLIITTPVAGDPPPWVIDQATLASWLRVQRVQDTPNSARFEVALDASALRAYLEPLAEPLLREAANARFIFNDDTKQLDVIQPSQAGRALDIDATLALINEELSKGNHTVALVFQITQPEASDTKTAADLGVTELVSQQSTYFVGSSAERVNNVKVAAARFHGLLVPPNAVFSFGEGLGDVSLDSGFAEALIIFGGRTIRGVGGGVCQVSTTVFRAAYFGGYPVVERWSHAYRVGYYERGDPGTWSGPGLDATVFTPLVDFKFQNDTPYWLLMEVYINEAPARITWKFYSTSDGREVQVSAADVDNVVPAPEPLYEEDPALPTGTIKQADYAADGADVTIYRTITRDGVVINSSEAPLITHYQPWRAIYHYGPGTEGIPTPTPTPPPDATATPNP